MRVGLRKVTKTVRGKKGSVRRSYWVRAKSSVSAFAKKHGKKALIGTAGALATAGLGALAYKHRASFSNENLWKHKVEIEKHKSAAVKGFHRFRKGLGARLGEHLVNAAGQRLIDYGAERAGKAVGRSLRGSTGKYGKRVGSFLANEAVSFLGHAIADHHIAEAGKATARAIRTPRRSS